VNFACRTFRDQQIKTRCVWVDGIRSLAFDNEGRIRIKAEALGLLSVKRGANVDVILTPYTAKGTLPLP